MYETGTAAMATKLVFNSKFDRELDIFGTQFLSLRNYISQRLLKQFEKHGITGYHVREPKCDLIFE
jgi:hypothetical protein